MSVKLTNTHYNLAYLVASGWTNWEISQLGPPDVVRRWIRRRPEHLWLQSKVKSVRLALDAVRNLDVEALKFKFEYDPTGIPGEEIYCAMFAMRAPDVMQSLADRASLAHG